MIQIDLPTRPAVGRFEERTGLPAWYLLFVLFWIGIGLLLYYGVDLNHAFRDLEPGIFTTIIQVLGWLYVLSIGLLLGWGWETGAQAKAYHRTVILGVTPSRQQIEAMFPRTRLGIVLSRIGFFSGEQDQNLNPKHYIIKYRGKAIIKMLVKIFAPYLLITIMYYLLSSSSEPLPTYIRLRFP